MAARGISDVRDFIPRLLCVLVGFVFEPLVSFFQLVRSFLKLIVDLVFDARHLVRSFLC